MLKVGVKSILCRYICDNSDDKLNILAEDKPMKCPHTRLKEFQGETLYRSFNTVFCYCRGNF